MGHILDTIGNIGTAIGKSPIGKFGHYALDAAALATGNPEFIPAIEGANSAAGTYGKTHDIGSALKSGAITGGATYAGSAIGNALGSNLGTFGSQLGVDASEAAPMLNSAVNSNIGGSVGASLGNFAGNAAGSLLNTGIGGAVGGYVGNSLANGINKSNLPQKPQGNPTAPAPFSPAQATAAAVPGSISGMSNLTPNQQSTGLANQGTYGGGLGPEENSYFLNLENRKLVNPNGSTNPLSSLQPIENSYLAKLGLGGYGDPTSLLQAISQWKPT